MNKTTRKETKLKAAELGRLGGKAIVKKKGKAYMKKLGQKGARARWGK